MNRMVWFAAGVGTALYGVVKVRKAAEVLSVEGARDRLGALSLGANLLATDVRTATAARKNELRQQYGLAAAAPTHEIDTHEIDTLEIDTEESHGD